MLLASCPLLLAVLHEWEFAAYAAYLFRAGAPDNSSVAGSAVQIAPTVNKPPGTRDLPTILWPWLRMILPAAQPTNCLAASNSRCFVRRSVSSSGFTSEISAVTAGKPSLEKARNSPHRSGAVTISANRRPRLVRRQDSNRVVIAVARQILIARSQIVVSEPECNSATLT